MNTGLHWQLAVDSRQRLNIQRGRVGRQRRPGARAACCSSNEEVLEWDVVAFPSKQIPQSEGGATRRVGVVEKIRSSVAVVTPLALEANTGIWLEDHDATSEEIALTEASVIQAEFAQRIDPDRRSNPHSEHAQNTWEIAVQLPPGVFTGEFVGSTNRII